jgi:hypothetical protein
MSSLRPTSIADVLGVPLVCKSILASLCDHNRFEGQRLRLSARWAARCVDPLVTVAIIPTGHPDAKGAPRYPASAGAPTTLVVRNWNERKPEPDEWFHQPLSIPEQDLSRVRTLVGGGVLLTLESARRLLEVRFDLVQDLTVNALEVGLLPAHLPSVRRLKLIASNTRGRTDRKLSWATTPACHPLPSCPALVDITYWNDEADCDYRVDPGARCARSDASRIIARYAETVVNLVVNIRFMSMSYWGDQSEGIWDEQLLSAICGCARLETLVVREVKIRTSDALFAELPPRLRYVDVPWQGGWAAARRFAARHPEIEMSPRSLMSHIERRYCKW